MQLQEVHEFIVANAFKAFAHIQFCKVAHIWIAYPSPDYFRAFYSASPFDGRVLIFPEALPERPHSLNRDAIIQLLLDVLDSDSTYFPAGAVNLGPIPDRRESHIAVDYLLPDRIDYPLHNPPQGCFAATVENVSDLVACQNCESRQKFNGVITLVFFLQAGVYCPTNQAPVRYVNVLA